MTTQELLKELGRLLDTHGPGSFPVKQHVLTNRSNDEFTKAAMTMIFLRSAFPVRG